MVTKMKSKDWQPISTAPHNKPVLVFYMNELGKCRTIKAEYIEKHQVECLDDYEPADYDPKTDQYYYPEAWYECIDNVDEFGYAEVYQGKPTHWHPLPKPPVVSSELEHTIPTFSKLDMVDNASTTEMIAETNELESLRYMREEIQDIFTKNKLKNTIVPNEENYLDAITEQLENAQIMAKCLEKIKELVNDNE